MQKVDFEYEIVVMEDASSDGTREIVQQLASDRHGHMRLYLSDPADAERDRARGMPAASIFERTLESCQGQYISTLDGDDYWTDQNKLQKQANYLDEHPECAIAFHNVLRIFEDVDNAPSLLCPPNQKPVSSIEDLLQGNFIPWSAAMFRNHRIAHFPGWFRSSEVRDWPLHVFNAASGNIGYLDDTMGAYRVHDTSYWSSMGSGKQFALVCKLLGEFNEYFDYKYDELIQTILAEKYEYYDNAITLPKAVTDLNRKVSDLAALVDQKTAQVAQIWDERQALSAEVARKHAEMAEQLAKLVQQQAELAQQGAQVKQQHGEIARLQVDAVNLRGRIAELNAKMAETTALAEARAIEADTLRRTLAGRGHRLVSGAGRAWDQIHGRGEGLQD
jgi:glycosyltransferase involved in cell wall biosynthesis